MTFVAAVQSIANAPLDRDMRVVLAEQARDRALQLLDAFEANIPYLPGSPLDRAVREARRRVEETAVPRA